MPTGFTTTQFDAYVFYLFLSITGTYFFNYTMEIINITPEGNDNKNNLPIGKYIKGFLIGTKKTTEQPSPFVISKKNCT